MKMRFTKLVIACAVMAPVAPALAQKRPPVPWDRGISAAGRSLAEFDPARDTTQTMERYTKILRYAQCATSVDSGSVRKALATQPRSTGEQRLWDLTERMRSCGPRDSNITALVRGSLSEAGYKKVAGKTAFAPISNEADLIAFLDRQRAFHSLREVPDQGLAAASACFAGRNPAGVASILSQRHGSDEESVEMDKLFAATPACAGPVRPLGISRTFLRAFLAEGLYNFAIPIEAASK